MKNVKGDPKNIGLENICRKFLCEKKQLIVLTIFILFFIFHKSDIKTENWLN